MQIKVCPRAALCDEQKARRDQLQRMPIWEAEERLFQALRTRDPELWGVGIQSSPEGWKCFAARKGADAVPFPEADALLADLQKRFEIVED